MRRILIVPLALLLAAPLAWGADDKAKDSPKGEKGAAPADEFKALQAEQQKAIEAVVKSFRETNDEKARLEIRQKFFKMQIDYAGKYVELAKKHSKDAVAVDALQQVIGITGMPGAEKVVDEALDLLAKDYAQSAQIRQVCQLLARSASPGAVKLLETVIEKNPDHATQGDAALALALNYKNRFKEADQAEADKLRKQAEKYFSLVVDKYGDVKNARGSALADVAKTQLNQMKNMVNAVVGKPVPELQGPDIDGKDFKISDYRGKVVLLDFWAHW